MDIKDLKLDDYPFKTYDKIRYRDTVRQNHVNNAVFSTFLETGRVEFYINQKNL
jgi:acyl-CoA thioester hydrolase